MSEQVMAAHAAQQRQAMAAQERRDEARRMYVESVAAELPMTAAALGEAFGRSARWGRDRIAEARTQPTPPATDQQHQDQDHDDTAQQPEAPEASEPADEPEPTEPPEVADAPPAPPAPVVPGVPAAVAVPQVPAVVGGMPPAAGGMPPVSGSAPSGRVVSWLAFGFGIAATVAANVAHTFYPSASQLAAWREAGNTGAFQPEAGAVIGAAFWPLALLLAVEVLARVTWPAGGWWGLARYGGAGAVAGVAAFMSYRHMAGLLTAWGEDPWSAHLGPLAVDGLMVLAGFALLSMGARRTARGL